MQRKLKQAAKITPVVDGSGLKHTLERKVVDDLFSEEFSVLELTFFITSGVDRWGMGGSH